jgi:ABC-type lipoprotein release transport system permease subunit
MASTGFVQRREYSRVMKFNTIGFAGAAFGVVAGGVIAATVMMLVPEVGHPIRRGYLLSDFGWAVFFSSPWGFITGAVLGGYLHERSRDTAVFRQLILEAIILTVAIATVFAQLLVSSASDLPRGRVTAVVALTSFICATIGAWILKPLYWRK